MVVIRATERFAWPCESVPLVREYRAVTGGLKMSVRACLYVSLPCGKERDREGT